MFKGFISILFLVIFFVLYFNFESTTGKDIKLSQCISKFPNYETTQKLEFEKCLNE